MWRPLLVAYYFCDAFCRKHITTPRPNSISECDCFFLGFLRFFFLVGGQPNPSSSPDCDVFSRKTHDDFHDSAKYIWLATLFPNNSLVLLHTPPQGIAFRAVAVATTTGKRNRVGPRGHLPTVAHFSAGIDVQMFLEFRNTKSLLVTKL